MGAQIRPLSEKKREATVKWPCDGKPRFTVREVGYRVPYSRAYDSILKVSGCTTNAEGGTVFTPDGLRRITALNKLYFSFAKDFIGVSLWRAEQEKKKAQTRVAAVEPQPA